MAPLARAVLVVALAMGSAPALGAATEDEQKARPPRVVTVGSWADNRVYLDAGRADGIDVGATVSLLRRRRAVGTCVVVDASAHHAACQSESVVDATRARFVPSVAPARRAPPPPLVPSSPSELQASRAALRGAVFEKVAHEPRARRGRLVVPVEVWASERAHVTTHRTPGTHLGRVSAALRGVPLYLDGLTLRGRADVAGAFALQEGTRFRPGEPVRPDVYELAVSYRPSEGFFFAEAGRLAVSGALGAPMIDGLALGLRLFDDRATVGAYGGLAPDPLRLLPRLDTVAGGAFTTAELALGPLVVRGHARAGVTANLALAARGDAEASVAAMLGPWLDAVAFARVSDELATPTLPWLDLAFAEVATSPLAHMRLGARWRTNAASTSIDLGFPLAGAKTELGRHRGDVFARYEPLAYLGGALDVGVVVDPATGLLRGFVGPELSAPRLFDGALALRLAWQEELGAARGRLVLASTTLAPAPRARVDARVYGIEEAAFGEPRRDVGGALRLDWAFFDYLRVFADARAQAGLPSVVGHPRATPVGFSSEIGVSGALY